MCADSKSVEDYCLLVSQKIFRDFVTVLDDLHERGVMKKSGHMNVRFEEGENFVEFFSSPQRWVHFFFVWNFLQFANSNPRRDEWFLHNMETHLKMDKTL